MTRQLVYEPYKHVVVGFRVSTRLTNHVGFGLTLTGWRVTWFDLNPTRKLVLAPLV